MKLHDDSCEICQSMTCPACKFKLHKSRILSRFGALIIVSSCLVAILLLDIKWMLGAVMGLFITKQILRCWICHYTHE